MTDKRRLYSLLALFFIPLAGISTDIYLPSLPSLTAYFHVSKTMVQYTVTTFTLGMGFMQLMAGPISDALGRKKLLLGSALVQIIAILLILFSPSMGLMIFYRFVQGSAAAFMIVPSRAIISDLYEGDALKKQFNYITICFALGPIVGPFIGGYLQEYFGWRSNFIFILCYAVIALLLIIFVLRETIPSTRRFSIMHLWHNYKIIVQNKFFVISSVFIGCMFAYTAFFNVAGPFLVEVGLQRSPVTFGHMALLIGFAWFIGNVLNRFLFEVNNHYKVVFGLAVTFIASLLMFVFSIFGHFTLALFIVPLFFMIMMSGGVFSIFASECLSLFRKLAASANAFLFGLSWTIFSLFSVIAAQTKAHSLTPVGIALLLISCICIAIYAVIAKLQKSPD
jgi:DHA1 family bicyclomycin/chloramphenicol resistance-like MFS transporter